MYRDKCPDVALMKPRYDPEKKELVIPCSRLVAGNIVEKSSYEFSRINSSNNQCNVCGEFATFQVEELCNKHHKEKENG